MKCNVYRERLAALLLQRESKDNFSDYDIIINIITIIIINRCSSSSSSSYKSNIIISSNNSNRICFRSSDIICYFLQPHFFF